MSGTRDQVPFTELPMLGGSSFLRGYPFERFRDRAAGFGSVQYQWDVSHILDAYLFADAGRVFPSIANVTLHGLRVGYGIELHRLPAYSPEFMAMEGVWKTTRKLTTHNAFFVTPDQRDAKLTETFNVFQRRPEVIAAHVARFQ